MFRTPREALTDALKTRHTVFRFYEGGGKFRYDSATNFGELPEREEGTVCTRPSVADVLNDGRIQYKLAPDSMAELHRRIYESLDVSDNEEGNYAPLDIIQTSELAEEYLAAEVRLMESTPGYQGYLNRIEFTTLHYGERLTYSDMCQDLFNYWDGEDDVPLADMLNKWFSSGIAELDFNPDSILVFSNTRHYLVMTGAEAVTSHYDNYLRLWREQEEEHEYV